MSKLYFKYGCMDSSKTANLLMTAHNYESQGKKVIILKPSLDSRSNKGMVESRIGLKHSCIDIDKDTNLGVMILDLVELLEENGENIDCILVDEAQFLTTTQVSHLRGMVDICNIPIICYGLKNTYVCGELFVGSYALLYFADKLEEIKTTCKCGQKATMNLRVSNGVPKYDGEVVNCGDTKESVDYYIPTCSYHYFNYNEL